MSTKNTKDLYHDSQTPYLAHLEKDRSNKIVAEQTLLSHLLNTGRFALEIGRQINCPYLCFLLTVYHDVGKACTNYKQRLLGYSRVRVNHSSAGAIYLRNKLITMIPEIDKRQLGTAVKYRQIMFYPILAHHGLFDTIGKGHNMPGNFISRIDDRMVDVDTNNQQLLSQETRSFIEYELNPAIVEELGFTIEKLILHALVELQNVIEKINKLLNLRIKTEDNQIRTRERKVYEGFFVRTLLSILKTADCLDSSEWCSSQQVTSLSQTHLGEIFSNYYKLTEKRAKMFASQSGSSKLNQVRTQLSELAQEHARMQVSGISQLEMPTGAGKTEAGLRYAVTNIKTFGKSRLFYVAPFLSVVEQSAKTIKEVVGDAFVLEHHSNVVNEEVGQTHDETELDKGLYLPHSYVVDYWDAAVVVTTMVQFYNTLFGGKAANICRFTKLINSTIILDEVQSLPVEHVYCFNLMLNYLVHIFNTNILLCTATQPPFDHSAFEYPIYYSSKKHVILQEFSDNRVTPKIDYSVFNRSVVWPAWLHEPDQTMSADEMLELLSDQMKSARSALCIFNTKAAVKLMYEKVKTHLPDVKVVYLTTNLCAAHRLDRIDSMREILLSFRNSNFKKSSQSDKLICITTSLIEAGVNVDFDLVFRSITGADSIEQARGRCNREGLLKRGGKVFVFCMKEDNTDVKGLRDIYQRGMITATYINQQTARCEGYQGLDMNVLTEQFYKKYYLENTKKMALPIKHKNTNALQLLSTNDPLLNAVADPKSFCQKNQLLQSFDTASQCMQLIDQDTKSIIVPYVNEAILQELLKAIDQQAFDEVKLLLRRLQRYTVNVFSWKNIDQYCSFVSEDLSLYILQAEYYDEDYGLSIDDVQMEALLF